MLPCPLCGHENGLSDTKCGGCGEDLAEYAKVYFAPHILYNKAVRLLSGGAPKEAIELLSAAHQLAPNDCDIIIALAEAYKGIGDNESAIRAYSMLKDSEAAARGIDGRIDELTRAIDDEYEHNSEVRSFLGESLSGLYRRTTGRSMPDARRVAGQLEASRGGAAPANKTRWLPTVGFAVLLSLLCAGFAYMVFNLESMRRDQSTLINESKAWMNGISAQYSDLKDDLDSYITEQTLTNDSLNEIIDEIIANLAQIDGEIDSLSNKNSGIAQQLTTIKSANDELMAEIARIDSATEKLSDSSASTGKSIASIMQKLNAISQSIRDLENQLDGIEERLP